MRRVSWILTFVFLVGCTVAMPVSTSTPVLPTITGTLLPYPRPTVTPQPTRIRKPILTTTSTLTPFVTFTPSVTPQLTFTPLPPLPTYLYPDSEQKIWALLINNGGCRLPCFWGITPGKTTEAEFLRFMSQFPDELEDEKNNGYYTVHYIPPVTTHVAFLVYFFVPDSIVEKIIIDSDTLPLSFPLTRLLQENGMPDKVLIGPVDHYEEMFVLYEKQKILGEYYLSIQDNYLCYDPHKVIGMSTWGGDEYHPFKDTISGSTLKPLEQVTEYDIKSFYKLFSTNNRPICMETLETNP